MRDLLLENATLTAKVANMFDTSVTAVSLIRAKHLDLVALTEAKALSLKMIQTLRRLERKICGAHSCNFGVKYVYLRNEGVQVRYGCFRMRPFLGRRLFIHYTFEL